MVSWGPDERREYQRVCAEHDRMMAEAREEQ
jgi:hypothetical protein